MILSANGSYLSILLLIIVEVAALKDVPQSFVRDSLKDGIGYAHLLIEDSLAKEQSQYVIHGVRLEQLGKYKRIFWLITQNKLPNCSIDVIKTEMGGG